jgi:hypothetical protein
LKLNIKEKSINSEVLNFLMILFLSDAFKILLLPSVHEARAERKWQAVNPRISHHRTPQRHLEGSERCSDSAHFKPRAVPHFLTALQKSVSSFRVAANF